jgi:hypothetical protein
MGPLDRELATKFMQQNSGEKLPDRARPTETPAILTQAVSEKLAEFQMVDALLYGGQGKTNKLITGHGTNVSTTLSTSLECVNEGEWAGLHPPKLNATGGTVRGDEKTTLRKENKLRRWQLKLIQIEKTQWTAHQGETKQSIIVPRELTPYRNSMCPS